MNINYFKQTRVLHKWMGLACFIFILVLSVSGILLMHSDSLELEKKMVGGQYLPKKYFSVGGSPLVVQSLAVTSSNGAQVIFAGTDHGLFRSGVSGQSWTKLQQGLFSHNIRVLAVSPEDPQVIYAGTPMGIFKSEDQGESWSQWIDQASGLTNAFINDLLIDPKDPDILYAATQGGLFVSNDGGDFWEPSGIPENQDVRTIRFSAAQPDHLIIGTGTGTFRSPNGGQHWEKKWEVLPQNIFSMATLNTDPEFIFVGTDSGLYKSFNGGLNWIKDENSRLKEVRSMVVDSRGKSVIYLASGNGLFSSKNSGDLWQEITPDKSNIQKGEKVVATSFNTIFYLAGSQNYPSILLAGSDSGLFISNKNGKLWNFIDFGESAATMSEENFRMDLAKLVTEIHTGRFFGTYFYWLVDVSTVGMIVLAFSGLMIVFYRNKVKKGKAVQKATKDKEMQVDQIIDIAESVDELTQDSQSIHDMVEHINKHLEKCKSIYSISKEKKEIERIGKHILMVDKKMHHLMEHIDDFGKLARDMGVDDSSSPETMVNQEHSTAKNTGA